MLLETPLGTMVFKIHVTWTPTFSRVFYEVRPQEYLQVGPARLRGSLCFSVEGKTLVSGLKEVDAEGQEVLRFPDEQIFRGRASKEEEELVIEAALTAAKAAAEEVLALAQVALEDADRKGIFRMKRRVESMRAKLPELEAELSLRLQAFEQEYGPWVDPE